MGDQLMLLLIGGDHEVFVSDASGVGSVADAAHGVGDSVFGVRVDDIDVVCAIRFGAGAVVRVGVVGCLPWCWL